ncbi:MAG: glycosyltransferase [Planctomycetes bacterium]|nr:glycosyltransferase [Planctomycetota bacterium]
MNSAPVDISIIIISAEPRKTALFKELMASFRKVLERIGRTHEVIVVDDGAGSTFAQAVLEVRAEWPVVSLLRFRRTFGTSVALDAAVERTRGRYVIVSTWYLQVDPEGIAEMVRRLDEGVDYVAVRREPRCDGTLGRIQSWLFNAYTRRLTGMDVRDLNCSFRAFRREVLEEIALHGDLFRFLSILAMRRGFRVVEIPLQHLREEGSRGVLHPGLYVRRFLDILSLFFLVKFTNKPLRFFGLAGLGFAGIGSAICIWMAWLRIFDDKGLTEKPLLILGLFLVILGFIIGSIGLIGEIIIFTQGRSLRDYHIDEVIGRGEDT